MSDCNRAFSHRKNYLDIINKIFNKNYKSLQEFKEEKHFKEILEKNISLNEVKNAIRRMTLIMRSLEKNKNQLETYQGYSWYLNNPSSNLGKIIAEIFSDCGIGF